MQVELSALVAVGRVSCCVFCAGALVQDALEVTHRLVDQVDDHFGRAHGVYASALSDMALMMKSIGKHKDATDTYLKALEVHHLQACSKGYRMCAVRGSCTDIATLHKYDTVVSWYCCSITVAHRPSRLAGRPRMPVADSSNHAPSLIWPCSSLCSVTRLVNGCVFSTTRFTEQCTRARRTPHLPAHCTTSAWRSAPWQRSRASWREYRCLNAPGNLSSAVCRFVKRCVREKGRWGGGGEVARALSFAHAEAVSIIDHALPEERHLALERKGLCCRNYSRRSLRLRCCCFLA